MPALADPMVPMATGCTFSGPCQLVPKDSDNAPPGLVADLGLSPKVVFTPYLVDLGWAEQGNTWAYFSVDVARFIVIDGQRRAVRDVESPPAVTLDGRPLDPLAPESERDRLDFAVQVEDGRPPAELLVQQRFNLVDGPDVIMELRIPLTPYGG